MHWIANRTRSHGPQTLEAVSSYGAGCGGQAGIVLSLAADNDPWVGLTFDATCTNMSAASPIELAVWGFGTTATPVTGLLGAGPACTLLNTADVIEVTAAAATSLSASFAIPADPSLAGIQLHLQAGEIDLAPGNLATSNGISLTIGG